VKENVQKRAILKRDMENRIYEYRQKIEDLRQSKAQEEMKAKKVANEIGQLDKQLSEVLLMAEDTKKQLEPVKVTETFNFCIIDT
jgi:uncharacterized sporulation protein YeaH/YhbH (DUF444 family)